MNTASLNTQDENSHGSLTSYVTGFVLSIAFTLLAYSVVVNHWLSGTAAIAVVVIVAIAQLLVQLFFFLHLGQGKNAHWNVLLLSFALIVIIIVVFGSIWIMNHLNYNMTPSQVNTYVQQDEGIQK